MRVPTTTIREAVEHMPKGATLVIHRVPWDEYESLVEDLSEEHFRVSYDQGKLEIMSPLREHEEYARFIDRLASAVAERLQVTLEMLGSTTWKRRRLARGVEPDACYYVANADRIIGKRTIDLESDPPPDIVVEIDITNESLSQFPVYAALRVPEIWHYDGETLRFYELIENSYREVPESRFFPGLKPSLLAEALEESKTKGQTAALAAFRDKLIRVNPRSSMLQLE